MCHSGSFVNQATLSLATRIGWAIIGMTKNGVCQAKRSRPRANS